MEPKPTSAGASLNALSNAINSVAPTDSPFATTRNQTYAPPSLGRIIPSMPQQSIQPPTPPLPPVQPMPMPMPTYQAPAYQAPQSAYTPRPVQQNTDHMHSPEHTVQTYDSIQRRSRVVPILTAVFILILLLITGALYLYGSMLVNKQPLTETVQGETSQIQQEIPASGFQVTESGATEPNFDSQLDQQFDQAAPATTAYPSTTPAVNTDTSQMFAE